jgi:hypothetical protein
MNTYWSMSMLLIWTLQLYKVVLLLALQDINIIVYIQIYVGDLQQSKYIIFHWLIINYLVVADIHL